MKKLFIIISIVIMIGSIWYISLLPQVTNLSEPVRVIVPHNTQQSSTTPLKDISVGSSTSLRTISILPTTIIPGVPVMVTISSSTGRVYTDTHSSAQYPFPIPESAPKQLSFDGKAIPLFMFDGSWRAFIPIDFNETKSQHEISVLYADGTYSTTSLIVIPHIKKVEPLGIPDKLGGNTPVAQKKLVDNLAVENATLNSIKTATSTFWEKPFRGPLARLVITDPYGYNRLTGNYTIAHKGTDFRADVGTEVMAMNSGVVRIAKLYTIYGNTVAIDHGLGVQTLYMHLSKLNVKNGDLVKAGDIIGLSGKTGYAESPHLHISIKIAGVSIDPMVFLGFFGVK